MKKIIFGIFIFSLLLIGGYFSVAEVQMKNSSQLVELPTQHTPQPPDDSHFDAMGMA